MEKQFAMRSVLFKKAFGWQLPAINYFKLRVFLTIEGWRENPLLEFIFGSNFKNFFLSTAFN
jgi:hypothetical protein